MWPCKNEGEDARLYDAVQGCSEFAIELGINIPTGKRFVIHEKKYPNDEVIAPERLLFQLLEIVLILLK